MKFTSGKWKIRCETRTLYGGNLSIGRERHVTAVDMVGLALGLHRQTTLVKLGESENTLRCKERKQEKRKEVERRSLSLLYRLSINQR